MEGATAQRPQLSRVVLTHAPRQPGSWLTWDVAQKMTTAPASLLTHAQQLEALAALSLHAVLKARGHETFAHKKHLSVSRADVAAYFRQFPAKAEALLLKKADPKPFHDALCVEARSGKFVIYDMDHGVERGLYWYDSLSEAATDFVAFTYGYGYPEGYGFKKEG